MWKPDIHLQRRRQFGWTLDWICVCAHCAWHSFTHWFYCGVFPIHHMKGFVQSDSYTGRKKQYLEFAVLRQFISNFLRSHRFGAWSTFDVNRLDMQRIPQMNSKTTFYKVGQTKCLIYLDWRDPFGRANLILKFNSLYTILKCTHFAISRKRLKIILLFLAFS